MLASCLTCQSAVSDCPPWSAGSGLACGCGDAVCWGGASITLVSGRDPHVRCCWPSEVQIAEGRPFFQGFAVDDVENSVESRDGGSMPLVHPTASLCLSRLRPPGRAAPE